jgi:hypothetical protein
MSESDPALSTQDAQIANVRIGGVEGRLSASDRLSDAEAQLAAHVAKFQERERAEGQAERERTLAASGIREALQAAAKASGEALTAALDSADKLEQERIARVQDKVDEVKEAATLALQATEKASSEYQKSAKETLSQHNGLIDAMGRKDATYQTKELAQEQRDALESRITEVVGGVRSDVQALTKRVDRGDGGASAVAADRQERHTVTGLQIAAMAVFATIFGGIVAGVIFLAAGG